MFVFGVWLLTVGQAAKGGDDEASMQGSGHEAIHPICPGFVWVAEREGQPQVYLVGAIHYQKKGGHKVDQWHAALREAYRLSGDVWVEVDPEAMDSPEGSRALKAKGYLSEGENLWRLVSGNTRMLLDLRVKESGLRNHIAGMRPWLAASVLSDEILRDAGMRMAAGVDRAVASQARRDGRSVRGFASPAEHYGVLAGMQPSVEESILQGTLLEWETIVSSVDKLSRDLRSGRVDVLERLSREAYPDPVLRRILLDDRNSAWAKMIEAATPLGLHLADGGVPPLVVVGGLHLVGEHGIIALLTKRGFLCRPLVEGDQIRRAVPVAGSPSYPGNTPSIEHLSEP